jgi:type IV secretory pathway TrbF-like protein
MKDELKQSAFRHSDKLIEKIKQVVELPVIVKDAIKREMEYATMDGYRITARWLSENNRNGDMKNENMQNEEPPLRI